MTRHAAVLGAHLAGFVLLVAAIGKGMGGQPLPIRLGMDAFEMDDPLWTIGTAIMGAVLTLIALLSGFRRRLRALAAVTIVAALVSSVAGIRDGYWLGTAYFALLSVALAANASRQSDRSTETRPTALPD